MGSPAEPGVVPKRRGLISESQVEAFRHRALLKGQVSADLVLCLNPLEAHIFRVSTEGGNTFEFASLSPLFV